MVEFGRGGERERRSVSMPRRRVSRSEGSAMPDRKSENLPIQCHELPYSDARIEKSWKQDPSRCRQGIGMPCLDPRNLNSDTHSAYSIAKPSFEAIVDSCADRPSGSRWS
jgi:hypothetical protein